jgi:hypothetical protein
MKQEISAKHFIASLLDSHHRKFATCRERKRTTETAPPARCPRWDCERYRDCSPTKSGFRAFSLGQRRKGFAVHIEPESHVKWGLGPHVPMLRRSRQRLLCVPYKVFFRGPEAR